MKILRFLIACVLVVPVTISCASPKTSAVNAPAKEEVSERQNPSSPEILPTPDADEILIGASDVAVGDRRFWNEAVNTPAGFDKASRALILLYAMELNKRRDAESKNAKSESAQKWLAKELKLARQNYENASKSCGENDWTCLGESGKADDFFAKTSKVEIPTAMKSWQTVNENFVMIYVAEQIRLAALFPRTTSEIDLFNENEWDGNEVSDRKFFLTFDDGPTSANGETDQTLKMLADENKTAVFFVLGKNFSNRQKGGKSLAEIYQGQCVAAHGWEHLSHQKGSKYADGEWKNSVSNTMSLLRNTFAKTDTVLPLFRPPYGQRKPDSGDFFQKENLQVALWNLDSQDWNDEVTAEDIINRMETLMLIKRRGVLLFHDIHPKAKTAVPVIIKELGNAVEWGDCHQISSS